jgi:hypothetical protein
VNTTPTRTYLGTIDASEEGEVFVVPNLDASPDEIRAAIEVANAARREASAEEARKLRDMFHLPDETKSPP